MALTSARARPNVVLITLPGTRTTLNVSTNSEYGMHTSVRITRRFNNNNHNNNFNYVNYNSHKNNSRGAARDRVDTWPQTAKSGRGSHAVVKYIQLFTVSRWILPEETLMMGYSTDIYDRYDYTCTRHNQYRIPRDRLTTTKERKTAL